MTYLYNGKMYDLQQEVANVAGVNSSTVSKHLSRHGHLDKLPEAARTSSRIRASKEQILVAPPELRGAMNRSGFSELRHRRNIWAASKFAQGHSQRKIAEALGVSRPSVHLAIKRGLDLLAFSGRHKEN